MTDRSERIDSLSDRLKTIRGIFDLPTSERKILELESRTTDPDLWKDAEAATALQRELSALKRKVGDFLDLEEAVEDAREMDELAAEDEDIASELEQSLRDVLAEVERLELQRMLSGAHDSNNSIVSINAGAGGTESQDWAQMVQRMMMRWAEARGFSLEVLDLQVGEEAGIKSVSFSVIGEYAYGYSKAEAGVHRLVRISPFDANKRRHTSFVSVSVAPEVDDSIDIEIRDEDLRVDTYRASGAGGQHVNKTDSAVRLTHGPTGIVVACQAERSQHKNRAKAMKMLKAKIFELELRKKAEEQAAIQGEKKRIEWGSQIRSYVLQPYRMVKDHRTGHESSNTDAVLNGDLDPFIKAYLLGDEDEETHGE
ncbi:MAG: peptide chain release factor 2 [Myxococcota bacterium]|nr:peptide chain release factor 2 [Myxococcota bacterium]